MSGVNYRVLDWPTDVLLDSINTSVSSVSTQFLQLEEVFKPEFVAFLRSFQASHVLCLKYPPMTQGTPHLDLPGFKWGINYFVGEVDQHESCWYRVRETCKPEIKNPYELGWPIVTYGFEDLVLVESVRPTKPMLFNASVPHCGTNHSATHSRITLSIRTKLALHDWESVLAYFDDWIIGDRP